MYLSLTIDADEAVLSVIDRGMGVALDDGSTILGKLTANGQVILINPNGVVFGGGAEVDVGGLVASVLDIKDSDFLAGNLTFERGDAPGTITNLGHLTAAKGGTIALLAPQIANLGVIAARLGTLALASGDVVTLDLAGDGKVTVAVDPATVKAQIDQGGVIVASGGQVLLSAKAANALLGGVINDSGVIAANSLTAKGGEITLDASGPITLTGAKLDASGATGGGTIAVGGWSTASVSLDPATSLNASATGQGDGGRISVIGGNTQVSGSLTAQGGAAGGDGGSIETSGHSLTVGQASISTAAPKGKAGTWLLDPYDLTVDATAATTIDTALATTNVTLQTTANANGSGDIIIGSALSWSANTTLTLDATHSVLVNANITATGASAGLTVVTNDGGTGGNLLTGSGDSVSLPTTAALTINGQSYTLINSAAALQAMATNGFYALAGNIDASSITSFTPIGYSGDGYNTSPTAFTGTLDGLGHVILNLSINTQAASNLGLFSEIGSSGTVRNLGLSNANVLGSDVDNGGNYNFLGILAGQNNGAIVNDSATGTVSGGVSGWEIGGLVGENFGSIVSANAAVTVSGGQGAWYTGGLIGENMGVLLSSFATGSVNGGQASQYVGGLVGNNQGTIVSAYATGAVSGDGAQNIGGLAGENDGVISFAYATGGVSGR